MTDTLTNDLKRTFERATLEHTAKHNLGGDGWNAYQKITEEFEQSRVALERSYAREYDTRVEVARAALIDEAGIMRREFTPRFGAQDRFNPAAIDRQAHRSVRRAHEAARLHLENKESDALRQVIDTFGRPPPVIPAPPDRPDPGPKHPPAMITTSPTRPR